MECGEDFHLDDCGGYNPPCECGECGGAMCRSCCEAEKQVWGPDRDDDVEVEAPGPDGAP